MTAIDRQRYAPARAAARSPRTRRPLATLARRRFAAQRPHAARARRPAAHAGPVRARDRPGAQEGAAHRARRYESFVAVGTLGLLIPLNSMFAGIGVIVDRESGAQRELLAAPIPRSLLVLGNLVVALARHRAPGRRADRVSRCARGIHFHATGAGVALVPRRRARSSRSRMYGVAETLASRVPEAGGVHRAACPAIAIVPVVPRRLALPDHARCPRGLTWFAKVPAAHPRARPHALRPARRPRAACTTSGA